MKYIGIKHGKHLCYTFWFRTLLMTQTCTITNYKVQCLWFIMKSLVKDSSRERVTLSHHLKVSEFWLAP